MLFHSAFYQLSAGEIFQAVFISRVSFLTQNFQMCICASPEPPMEMSFPKVRARSSGLGHIGKRIR